MVMWYNKNSNHEKRLRQGQMMKKERVVLRSISFSLLEDKKLRIVTVKFLQVKES